MCKEIYKHEKKWIKTLMNINFKGKDILLKQLSKAKTVCTKKHEYISLKFEFDDKVEPYPYKVRVPIEMIAVQDLTEPIVFLLHVINGVINELEVFTANLTDIDENSIMLDNVRYIIDKEVEITD